MSRSIEAGTITVTMRFTLLHNKLFNIYEMVDPLNHDDVLLSGNNTTRVREQLVAKLHEAGVSDLDVEIETS